MLIIHVWLKKFTYRNTGEVFMEKVQYTTGKIFRMSVPVFIELLLQMLVGNVDQMMVSRHSQVSVAAIGNANQIMNIIIIVLNVMCAAAGILISQYLGAKDEQKIEETVNVSFFVTFVFSAVLTFLAVGLRYPILRRILNAPEDVAGEAAGYLAVVGSLILVQGCYMTFAAALRSHGFMKDVMMISVIMNLVNIAGNAILINGWFFFPTLGIIGAAVSTDLSKLLGLLLIYRLFRKKTDLKLTSASFHPFPSGTLKKILAIGIPSGGEELSYNLSQIAILSYINIFGTAVIAAKIYSSMFANVAYVYSMAIAQATQIVVGYLVGAGSLEQIAKRVWSTMGICIGVSVTLTAVMWQNSDALYGLFTTDPTVLGLGRVILGIEIFLEIGRSINIVMTRCLFAVGDVRFPVMLGISSQWLVSVLLSYFVGVRMGHGLPGIWFAMALDENIRGVLFVIRFKKNAWMKLAYRAR